MEWKYIPNPIEAEYFWHLMPSPECKIEVAAHTSVAAGASEADEKSDSSGVSLAAGRGQGCVQLQQWRKGRVVAQLNDLWPGRGQRALICARFWEGGGDYGVYGVAGLGTHWITSLSPATKK